MNYGTKPFFSHWKEVRSDLLSTIDLFPDDELTYIPFDGSQSVGQIMLHIADAEDGWFRYVVTKELKRWPDYFVLKKYPTREAIKSILGDVHARTESFLASLDETDFSRRVDAPWGKNIQLGWIIWHVLEHEIHHRGELSLILGLKGREGLEV